MVHVYLETDFTLLWGPVEATQPSEFSNLPMRMQVLVLTSLIMHCKYIRDEIQQYQCLYSKKLVLKFFLEIDMSIMWGNSNTLFLFIKSPGKGFPKLKHTAKAQTSPEALNFCNRLWRLIDSEAQRLCCGFPKAYVLSVPLCGQTGFQDNLPSRSWDICSPSQEHQNLW